MIAVRAGTARLRKDPERSQAALEAIEELARKTVAEIDQIVGTLRERGAENGAVDAPPGLASLDTLVGRHSAAGLDVSVASDGEPAGSRAPSTRPPTESCRRPSPTQPGTARVLPGSSSPSARRRSS